MSDSQTGFFFRLSDKRSLPNAYYQKNIDEDKSLGAFFTAENCVFVGL